MIKTYLVPTTEEMINAMESGEAPSFLHCATCLDGLTNGELITRIINPDSEDCVGIECKDGIVTFQVTQDAWDRKHGE